MTYYDWTVLPIFDHLAIPDRYISTIICNLLLMLNEEKYSIDVKFGIIIVIEQYYLSNPEINRKINMRVILQHYYDYIRGYDSYNNNRIIPKSHFLCTNNILSSIVKFFLPKGCINFCFIDYEIILDILILCLERYDELMNEKKPENSLIIKIRPNDYEVSLDTFRINIMNCYQYLSLVEFEKYSHGTEKYFEFKRLVRKRNWNIKSEVKSFIIKSEVIKLNLEKSNFIGFLKEFASFYLDDDSDDDNTIDNELQSEAIIHLREIYLQIHQIYDEEFIVNIIIPHIKKLFLSQQGIQFIATLWKKCKTNVFQQFIKETDKILEVPILKNVEWLHYVMALFYYLLLRLCKNHKTRHVLILYKYFIQLFQQAEHPIIHYHLLKYFQLIECDYHNHFVLSVKNANGSIQNYVLYDSTCNIDEYNKNPKLIYFDIPPLLQTLCNFITGQKIYQLLISSILTLTKLISFPIFLKNYSLSNLIDCLSFIIHSPTGLFKLSNKVINDEEEIDNENSNNSNVNNNDNDDDDVKDVNDNGDIEGNESDTIISNKTYSNRNRKETSDSNNINNDNDDIIELDPMFFIENDSYKLLNEYQPTNKEEISKIQNKCYILLADLSIYNNQMSTKDADTIFKNLTDAMNNIFHQIRHYDIQNNNSDSDTMLIISRKRSTSTCTTTLRTRFNSMASERGNNNNFNSNNSAVIHPESLSDFTPDCDRSFSVYNSSNGNTDYSSILYDSQLVLRHLLYALITFIVKYPLHFSLSDCLVYLPEFILQMNMTQDEYPLPLLIMSLSQCADYVYGEIRNKGNDFNSYFSLIEEWIMRITDITVAVLQLEKDCTTVDFLILETIRVYIKWLNECPRTIASKSAEKVFPYLIKRQHSKSCLTSTVAMELLYEVFSPYKLQAYPPPVDLLVFSDKIKVNDKEYSAVSHYIYKNMLISLRYGLNNIVLVTKRKTFGVSQYVVELDNITSAVHSIRYLPEFNTNYQQQQQPQSSTHQKRKHSLSTPPSPSPFYNQIRTNPNNPILHIYIPPDFNQGSDSTASDTSNSNSARSTPSFTSLPYETINNQLIILNQQQQQQSKQLQRPNNIPSLNIPTNTSQSLSLSSSPGIPLSIKFPPASLSTIAEANNSCRTEDALSCDSRNASDYMYSPTAGGGRLSPTMFGNNSDISISSSKERAFSDDSIKLTKDFTNTLNNHSSNYSTDSDNTPVDLPKGLLDLSERDNDSIGVRVTSSLGSIELPSTKLSFSDTSTVNTTNTSNTTIATTNDDNSLQIRNNTFFKQHSNPETFKSLSSKAINQNDNPVRKIRKVYSEVFRQSSYDRIRSLSHDSSYSHFKKDHRKMKDLHARRTSSIGNSDGDHPSSSDKTKSDKVTRYSAISQSDSNLAGMLQQKIDNQIMESPMSVSRRSVVVLPTTTATSASASTSSAISNTAIDVTDIVSDTNPLPVGRNSKTSLVSSEYYCNSNHSSANNLILPVSALPDTNTTYYNSCSFDDNNSNNNNSESSLSGNVFSSSPPKLKGKSNCAYDILLENAESSSSDSATFADTTELKPIQTPPPALSMFPKYQNKISKISLDDDNNNTHNNNNNNSQENEIVENEYRISEFSSSIRSESIPASPNPYIIHSSDVLDVALLQKKTHKHHKHRRHHKNHNNNTEMSPRDDGLTVNPPTAQTILSSHFKKPFIDIQCLGILDPLGSSSSHWGMLNGMTNDNCPLLVENDKSLESSIKVLDHTNPKCCHKIGILFAKSNQYDEWEIYKNTSGTVEYEEFLQKLGKYYKLSKIDPNKMYLGGLSQHGSDGEIVLISSVSTSEVLFHVSTLFPTNNSDENHLKESLINKKKHLGNDFVNIIYTFNQQLFQNSCPFKTNFTSVFITVTPVSENYVKVLVYGKEGIPPFGPLMLGTYILSNDVAPQLILQTAVNADIVCRFIYEDIIGPVLSVQERAEQLSKLYNKIKQTCPRPCK